MLSNLRNENTRQLYHTNGNILSTLDTNFYFSFNIYITINNTITTTYLITMLLTSIVHILNFYFEFINPSWLLNSKQQPRQFFEEIQKAILSTENKNKGVIPNKQSTAWKYQWSNSPNNKQTPRQLGRSFQKPSRTATKGIPVQHRKKMENPN